MPFVNSQQLLSQNFFINNSMGAFFRGTLNYFADTLYPRFNYRVMGSYDKSVEYFTKKTQFGREMDSNIVPSITLDPSYDFLQAEQGGKFLWQTQQLAPGLGNLLFDSYSGFEDQGILVTPVFSRYEGTFDLIFWLNSVYELMDLRVHLLQFSGGLKRKMRPDFFESYIVLPEFVNNYQYQDENSVTVPIDWSNSPRTVTKVNNIGKNCHTLPVLLNPWFNFDSISDASTKYGGDSITEYKMVANVTYEIEIPTYLMITPSQARQGERIQIDSNIELGAISSRYGRNPQLNENTGEIEKEPGKDIAKVKFSSDELSADKSIGLCFVERAFYLFTQTDEDNFSGTFNIPNPFGATELPAKNIKIATYVGELLFGQHWQYINSGATIQLLNIEPIDGEIVEFFRYE